MSNVYGIFFIKVENFTVRDKYCRGTFFAFLSIGWWFIGL